MASDPRDPADPGLTAAVPFTWACHRSGRCCTAAHGHVWLRAGELESLAAALALAPEAFRERYTCSVADPRGGAVRTSLREVAAPHGGGPGGGRCCLLEGANRCRVYEARPRQCRMFPYWKAALSEPLAFERVRSVCPGVAVVPDAAQRRAGFAALESYLDELPAPGSDCTFVDHGGGEVWATGLEVDYALASVEPVPGAPSAPSAPGAPGLHGDPVREPGGCPFRAGDGCRAGAARPTVCRPASAGASAAARLRAIVEEVGYPPGFGSLVDMVRSRDVCAGAAPERGAGG